MVLVPGSGPCAAKAALGERPRTYREKQSPNLSHQMALLGHVVALRRTTIDSLTSARYPTIVLGIPKAFRRRGDEREGRIMLGRDHCFARLSGRRHAALKPMVGPARHHFRIEVGRRDQGLGDTAAFALDGRRGQ